MAIVFKAGQKSTHPSKGGVAVSWRAMQFALACDKVESAAERLVLIEFADHADDRGYTYPSIEFIASRCRLDRKTVRRGIASLLVRRTIYGTKKRCGPTGQVKVYRMPKITYESGCKRDALKRGLRVLKESHKSPISGCKRDPNRVTRVTSNHVTRVIGEKSNERAMSSPTRTRPYSSSGEDQLLGALSRALGTEEMNRNGGMWRHRIRKGRDEQKAILYTLEDFENRRTSDRPIRNGPAWFTDKYQHNLKTIKANGGAANTVPGAPISQPPPDPIKHADFQRRLEEWKAKGRPLGEFPE